jgi:hypothetical protein
MKYFAIIPVIFLLLVSVVSADNHTSESIVEDTFTFELNAVKNKISVEDLAEFELKITNKLDKEIEYRVYSLSFPNWEILTKPLVNPIIVTVSPLSSKVTSIYLDPLSIKAIGKYLVEINVKSGDNGETLKENAEVVVKSTGDLVGGYSPSVTVNVNMPKSIDPRDEVPIRIELINNNIIEYDEVLIRLESDTINREIVDKLGPEETKTIEIVEKIDEFTLPQDDVIQITLTWEEEIIKGPLIQPVEIVEYSSVEEDTDKKPLATLKQIIVKSNNPEFTGPIRVETSRLRSMFTSIHPRAEMINVDGTDFFEFNVELEENMAEIRISENYLPLILVVVLAIVAVILYLIYRSPLVIRKSAQNLERSEGGISQMKIILTVKNRSKVSLQSVEIIDKVPNIVDIEKEVHLGILQPIQILRHENKGSVIKWLIDDLNPTEERVISYRIKSALPIIGEFSLESAFSKFKMNGKEKITHSNTLSVA